MERFHVIEEAAVILRARGVYKQAKVYRRGDGLYAGALGGFVQLYAQGGTAVPSLSWEDIELPVGGRVLGKTDLRPGNFSKLIAPAQLLQIEGRAA